MTPELLLGGSALAISLVAGWYTVRQFLLKVGTRIHGSFSMASSIACDDKYVSHVTLYNLKDRAVAVFKIYLQIGRSCYIELDDFESSPLILQPFAAWHRDYEPIEMYTCNSRRVDIEGLLQNRKARQCLVVATAEGRYVVKNWIHSWDPVMLFFENYETAILQQRRSQFEGTAYGSNAKYVVELTRADGGREVVPIFPSDHSIRKFRSFRLTAESLVSARSLEEFLLQQAISGTLACRDLKVHDLETWRLEAFSHERGNDTIRLEHPSWFRYNVLGRLGTKLDTWRMRRENTRRHKEALAQSRMKGKEHS